MKVSVKFPILFTLILVSLSTNRFIFSDHGSFALPDEFSPKIYAKHTIGQTFISNFPNLCKVGVFVVKDDLMGTGKIIFHLTSSVDSSKDIVRLEVNTSEVTDNWRLFRFPPTFDRKSYLYFFQFPPISYSEKKNFYFYLESPGTTEESGLRFGITRNKFRQGYSGGVSYLDSVPQEWYLLFQTYCAWQGDVKSVLREIIHRLLMDKQFITIYALICFIIFLALIYTNLKLQRFKKE